MFVLRNILDLICICLNFVLYSSVFFFTKLFEASAFFNPIIDVMPKIRIYIYIKGTKEKIKKLLIFLLIYAELLFVFYF